MPCRSGRRLVARVRTLSGGQRRMLQVPARQRFAQLLCWCGFVFGLFFLFNFWTSNYRKFGNNQSYIFEQTWQSWTIRCRLHFFGNNYDTSHTHLLRVHPSENTRENTPVPILHTQTCARQACPNILSQKGWQLISAEEKDQKNIGKLRNEINI